MSGEVPGIRSQGQTFLPHPVPRCGQPGRLCNNLAHVSQFAHHSTCATLCNHLAGARAAGVAAAAGAQASGGFGAQPVVPSPPAAPSVNPPPVPPAAPAVPVVARVVQQQHAVPAPPSVAPPKLMHQPSPPGPGAGIQAAEPRGAEAAMAANKMPAQVRVFYWHPTAVNQHRQVHRSCNALWQAN